MNVQIAANSNKPIILWLYSCAFMVFAMMIIGAITRLTESGLSIVEWNVIMGTFPPMNEAHWQSEFELYKQSPEFLKKNFWMSLEDFKNIYFWEWFHRLWGRLIGLVFALPLLIFWLRGMIPSGYKLKLLGLLALGGAQGFMGWYMVQSGLNDIPAVSHYRLAAHLSLAFVILAALLLLAFSLSPIKKAPSRGLFTHGLIVFVILSITILWGAFTAGLDAGLVYNETFPLMGGQWVPPDFWAKGSLLHTILENHSAVQFTHRWLAVLTVLAIFSLWVHGGAKKLDIPALHGAALMAFLQLGLGIATLLSGVNIVLATLHQGGGAILFSLLVLVLFQLWPQPAAKVSRP